MNKNYKGVIFDLDGTLLDTLKDLAGSVNAALSAFGFPVYETEAYRFMIGNGFSNLIMRAIPEEERSEENHKKVYDAFLEDYSRRYYQTTVPYQGVPEMVKRLKHEGIPMAVNSNKRDDYTKDLIRRHFPEDTFVSVIGGRADLPHKPDPAAAYLLAGEMGLSPEEILYIGDSGVDIDTAKNAGMGSLGAAWGFRGAEELLEHGADFVAADPEEMTQMILLAAGGKA